MPLRLGRCAVDLVGENDLGEHRPGLEDEAPAVLRLAYDLGARDVGGHQVGGELHAAEAEGQRLGQRTDQQRLAEAGHALQQRVAAREQAGQHALDYIVVTDHGLADLLADALEVVLETLGGFGGLLGRQWGGLAVHRARLRRGW